MSSSDIPEDKCLSKMQKEFIALCDKPLSDFKDEDAKVFQFVKSWHRFPEFHDILTCHGINLGEMSECALMQEAMAAMEEAKMRLGSTL